MIVSRRTFQAKVGKGGAVIENLKKTQAIVNASGMQAGRILTDYLSGATDRISWELEVEDLSALEALMNGYGDMGEQIGPIIEDLYALIDGASVEHWHIVE
tara:strand:+ start:1064 stop:1366 length:303 start_codon:yes stop_codon:yes gene_type:complete